jgi:hypothetical protein
LEVPRRNAVTAPGWRKAAQAIEAYRDRYRSYEQDLSQPPRTSASGACGPGEGDRQGSHAAIARMFEKVAEHGRGRAREVEQAVERVVELGLEKR